MAVAEQQVIRDEPGPRRTSRQQRVVWPKPSQLRQSVPILRLLAELWAIPEVSKVGLSIDPTEVHLWIIMPVDDRAAVSQIILAEREYLQSTQNHRFVLDVVPLSRVSEEILPPFETIFER